MVSPFFVCPFVLWDVANVSLYTVSKHKRMSCVLMETATPQFIFFFFCWHLALFYVPLHGGRSCGLSFVAFLFLEVRLIIRCLVHLWHFNWIQILREQSRKNFIFRYSMEKWNSGRYNDLIWAAPLVYLDHSCGAVLLLWHVFNPFLHLDVFVWSRCMCTCSIQV